MKLAVTIPEAAAMLGVSENHFRRVVLPHVDTVRLGAAVRVSVASLEAFVAAQAAPAASVPATPRPPRKVKETGAERLARFERLQKKTRAA